MKKLLVVLAIVAMCGSIAQAGTGSCTSGSMKVNFSGANFVIGLGWSGGSSRTITWSGSCSGCNYGPAVYGWGSSPLVEYYIGRGGGSSAGTYSANGSTYTLQINSCNGPNITGSGPFSQYNASGNGGSGQNMGQHFTGWSNLGKGISSQNYQVVAVESWSSGSGSASVSVPGSSWYTVWNNGGSATFTCGGGGSTTTTTSGGSGTVVVRARGTSGAESVTAFGSTWTLGTSMSNHSISSSATSGTVCYTNDASGRDVQIDYVVFQGSTKQAESQSYNTGVYQNSKCGGSNSEWLNCNGCIGF